MQPPLFIEVVHSEKNSDLQICRKVMQKLFRRNISPLPFASSINEIVDVLHVLRRMKLTPSVFVVNTYWAEDILRDLDAVTGDIPLLLLERSLENPREKENKLLQDMDLRKVAHCVYGAKTSDKISDVVANALAQFLSDGHFWHIEALGGLSPINLRSID